MRALAIGWVLVAVGLTACSSVAAVVATEHDGPVTASNGPTLFQVMTTVAIARSHDYAGYAVAAAKNVSVINAEWKIPKVHGACPTSKDEATFVGISLGGLTTKTVAFAGTETVCYLGTAYYDSYYVLAPYAYSGTLTVAGGDRMAATITYVHASHTATIYLKDLTKGTGLVRNAYVAIGRHTDALWVDDVAETTSGAILPLVRFGNVTFSDCTAAINGTASHPLGHYSNTAIEMYNKANTAFKAAVGVITSTGKGFTVYWKSTGP
jgi:peptidase A4-like protein